MAKQPATTFRIGYVKATVWQNESHYNVVLSRAYKDGDEWKESDSLGHNDILNAVRVLQRAENFIADQN